MSFTTVTVTGKYLTPAGAAEVGTVAFTLSAPIMDAAGKVIRSTATATATLDATGAFSLALPANDDTGTVPTGTTYSVVEQLKGGLHVYSVVVPHTAAAGTVDITALAPVSNTSVVYGVTSVNGQTGAVTVSTSSVSLADKGNWITATPYVVGDLVTQGGSRYICETAHTSGTFATDLAAAKWSLTGLATAASAPTRTALTASTTVAPVAVSNDVLLDITMDANLTLTLTATNGTVTGVTIAPKQDGTGGRTLTITNADWGTAGAPTLSAATKRDFISALSWDGGATWFCFLAGSGGF